MVCHIRSRTNTLTALDLFTVKLLLENRANNIEAFFYH